MKIRFYIDPATGLPHIYSHDVSEAESRMFSLAQWKTDWVVKDRG